MKADSEAMFEAKVEESVSIDYSDATFPLPMIPMKPIMEVTVLEVEEEEVLMEIN